MTDLTLTHNDGPVQLVILAGQAGAGMSTALAILEDAGFKTVDNIPLALVDQLVALEVETEKRRLAITVDMRTTGFTPDGLRQLVQNRRAQLGARCQLVFLSADEKELLQRYQTTRRRHPLDEGGNLPEAITADRTLLREISDFSDITIDTSGSAPASFRAMLLTQLGLQVVEDIPLSIISFSYRRGLPESADYVFDMRFVRNPHWDVSLRAQTGQAQAVQDFIASDPQFQNFMQHLKAMMTDVLGRFSADGRTHITVAFGCTGGKHRSVAAAEAFADFVRDAGLRLRLQHREL